MQFENGFMTLDEILKTGKKYATNQIVYILKTIVKQLAILQSNGIAHRNIQTQNIILVDSQKLKEEVFYKITDFAFGCVLPNNQNMINYTNITGYTTEYVAPEV